MRIDVRNKFCDDNFCEMLASDHNCEVCCGCQDSEEYFEINNYDDFVVINFYKRFKNLVLHEASERIDKIQLLDFLNSKSCE